MKGNSLKRRPPVVLVKTWVDLISSSESEEVKDRVSNMLLNSFSSLQEATEFCRNNERICIYGLIKGQTRITTRLK